MSQNWDGAEMSEVAKFYYPAKNSAFYFHKSDAENINSYFRLCFDIADTNRRIKGGDQRLELITKAKEADEFAKVLELKLIGVITVA